MPVTNAEEVGFIRMRRRFLPMLQERQATVGIPEKIYLSSNTKTGISINVSIAGTCNPTKLCMSSCYAMRGPMVFSESQKRQTENFILFQYLETAPESEVVRIVHELAKDVQRGRNPQNWFRWNGSGDLIPGSVRVINKFAELYPNIIQWVISRKPAMIETLADHPAIRLLVSLDETTPMDIKLRLLATKKRFKRTHTKFSYIRTSEDQKINVRQVSIVFNEHIGLKKVNHKDSRTCPATTKDASHEGACNKCRKCFS